MLERQLVVYSSHRLAHLAERTSMPLNDVKALEIITALEIISTGQLAHLLGISSGGVTALINRLETADYIERERHAMDRRIIVIRPKSDAPSELPHATALAAEHVERSASRYDLDQLELIQDFLLQCTHLLKDETMRWMEMGQHRVCQGVTSS
jgi:DNA-binding MarR family transcriptional regulator